MRARYLYDMFPNLKMLVTTFNLPLTDERLRPEFENYKDRIDVINFDKLCKAIFEKKIGHWPQIQDPKGVINALLRNEDLVSKTIKKFGIDFIIDEIIWMKEVGLTDESYLTTIREGRGKISGVNLSLSSKADLLKVFNTYQQRINDIRVYDWSDMRMKVLEFLKNGLEPEKKYDLILIDEAQHFAPFWIKIILAHLKERGSIFLCDDPSQSVYRLYSWEQKGIAIRGRRTRWLKTPYRTTREIFQAGYSLIETNPTARRLLDESGENIIPEYSNDVRSGDKPQAWCFSSFEREKDFVSSKIKELSEQILLSEIAVLHTQKHVLDTYRDLLPKEVKVEDLKRITGMEYKVVFIPRLHQLYERNINQSYEQDVARNQIDLYMAVTRARDHVFLLYGQKLLKEYEPMRSKIDWFN